MARRRYLVAYDIRDDRRLRSIASCVEGYGTRIQYSVFVCDLSDQEAVLMRGDIETRMKPSEDSVMVIDLGMAGILRGSSSLAIMRNCPYQARSSSDRASAPVVTPEPGSARTQVRGRSRTLISP